MPHKTKKKAVAAALPSIPKELLDQLVTGPMSAEQVNATCMALKKALIERALGAELSHHLGYAHGGASPLIQLPSQWRLGQDGVDRRWPAAIEVPRDRAA